MTITVSEEDSLLFEQNGFSYDDVSDTVQHYRESGLSDDEIQNKINARLNEFRTVPHNRRALENTNELGPDDPYVQTKEYQQEQLAHILFTPEELKAIDSQGKMGWVEYRTRFVTPKDYVPGGMLKQGYDSARLLNISKKLENNEEVSDADKDFMYGELRKQVEISRRGLNWGAKAASMFVQAPAFMIEFAATGGLGKAAAYGAIKAGGAAATKAAIKAGTKVAASKIGAMALGREATEKVGTRYALNVSAEIVGRTAASGAILTPAYAYSNYGEMRIADGLKTTDKGEIVFSEQKDGQLKTAMKAIGVAGIEVASESMGGVITSGIGKIANKVASTSTVRGISAVSAKVYNQLPKATRIKLEASAKAVAKFTNEKAQAVGFHGVFGEMAEERAADILKVAFDLDNEQGYSTDQWLEAFYPGHEELLLEAGIFSIMGSASLATRTVVNNLLSKGYSTKEAQNIVNNLSENEKENIANEILGEVPINEDISEEEVNAEVSRIKTKMKNEVINGNTKFNDYLDEKEVHAEIAGFNGSIEDSEVFRNFYSGKLSESTIGELLNHSAINEDIEDVKDIKVRARNNYTLDTAIKDNHIYGGSTTVENGEVIVYTNTGELSYIDVRDNLFHELQHARQLKNALSGNQEAINLINEVQTLINEGNFEAYKSSLYEKEADLSKEYLKDKIEEYYAKQNETNRTTNRRNDSDSQLQYEYGSKSTNADKTGNGQGQSIESGLERITADSERGVQQNQSQAQKQVNKENIVDKIIRGESKWGRFYTDWFDRYTPIENLVKKAEQKTNQKISDEKNPYFQARMYAGVVESIKQQINDKTFVKKNGKIEITGEGFLPIIKDYVKDIKDVEADYDTAIEDLTNYLVAQRFLLDLKDREGFEATEEQKIKAVEDMTKLNLKYGDKIDDISKIAERIYEYNRRILHNLVDSGNMSEEQYNKIIEDNPHHISYKRVMDDTFGSGVYVNSEFTDAKSPVKKIKGSDREIQNIFVSTLENVSSIIETAERNRVAKSIADLKGILPEYIETVKPLMQATTAKVKVAYDSKLRSKLESAIKFFGGKLEYKKSLSKGKGLVLGDYSPAENKIRKRLGSQDRTLAHEFGHMLDFVFGVRSAITNNFMIMQEISKLAEERFNSVVSLQHTNKGMEFVETKENTSEKYEAYVKSDREMIANMFDLYFTSRDYMKKTAPTAYKFIEALFKGKDFKFLKDIRPSAETGIEEIEQEVWMPSIQKPFGNVITYYENGKRKFVEVTKPVMEAVEGLSSQEIDFVKDFLAGVSVGSATVLRKGSTMTPEFAIKNYIRDLQNATIYTKGYNPAIDSVKGLFNVLGKKITGKNSTYDEWAKAGGAFSSYMELDEKSVKKALKEFAGEESRLHKIFTVYANPVKWFEEFSSIFEQATRLGIYTHSKLNGNNMLQAAFESREGTLDFARSGKKGRLRNKHIPFFNANLQGLDKMIRMFRDHPYLCSVKAVATITLPQLALTGYYLYAAPDDDRQEYLDIPQWQKNFFYCFKIADKWIKIPKDFALGYIFSSIPEKFMIWSYENRKPEGKEIAKMTFELYNSLSPVSSPVDLLPPILRILIEDGSNYDFYRGKHIYPEYMKDLELSERSNKWDSETAKLLGEKLNLPPALIDHTIQGLLGSSGKYVTDAGDLMINSIRQFNDEDINEKPTNTADLPFIRGFIIRDPVGYQTKSVNDFFDVYKDLEQKSKTYKKKKGEEKHEYYEKNGQKIRAFKRMDNYYDRMKELNKRIDKIYGNKNLSGEEKTERIQPLAKRISSIAYEANTWYKEYVKE